MIKMLNICYYNTSDNIIEKNNKFLKGLVEDLNINIITSSISLVNKFKTLNKIGGLVITGDFEIVNSDIRNLLLNDLFFVYDNNNKISSDIFYIKDSKNETVTEIINLLEKNQESKLNKLNNKDIENEFNNIVNNMFKNLICNKSTKLFNNSYIYSKEYFYPIGINRYEEKITENTICLNLFRKLYANEKFLVNNIYKNGLSATRYIITLKDVVRTNIGKKKYKVKRKVLKSEIKYVKEKQIIDECINKIKSEYTNSRYIVLHNSRWLGVTSATYELFENYIDLQEISKKVDARKIAKAINNSNIKQVILSAFCAGWEDLCIEIKKINPNIKIKCFYHGSHSQIIEEVNNELYTNVIKLHKERIISKLATCKESLYEFYKTEGYDISFIKNTVRIKDETKNKIKEYKIELEEEIKKNKEKKESNKLKIGIYAAGNDWRKNVYNSFASASLLDNSIIDTVVVSDEINEFAKYHNINVIGSKTRIEREKLLAKMALNDINLYVTFSECAPMLPLESLEMGTVCITGNNHHYFNGKLKDYLVVDREDDVIAIKDKIKLCLDNKDEILKLYKSFKESYDSESKKSVKEFLSK